MKCHQCGTKNSSDAARCLSCGAALADGLSAADLERLSAHLPSELAQALRRDPASPAALQAAAAHLTTLLKNVAAHLPADLVERVLADPVPGQPDGRFVDGALLFADISGFTAMSESLSRIGREGAEEITTIINAYFSAMLAILRERGGQLIKFGGDAMLGLFVEPGSADRAVQTALAMQAAMSRFAETPTSQGTFPLHMKVAVQRGRFFAAQLGSKRGMEYALIGAAVNAAAAVESIADSAQVLVDRTTRAALGLPHRARPVKDDGHFVIDQIDPAAIGFAARHTLAPATAGAAGLRRAADQVAALSIYLPSGLLARLAGDQLVDELRGDHRRVAVLFANVYGLGDIADGLGPGREEAIVAALNRYFVAMDDAVQRFGGVINKIDLADRGDKLLAFFGAPVAHEDDAERAVRAALEMQQWIEAHGRAAEGGGPALSQQIGLAYGYVFAGFVGAEAQREYTVMGDEVNLAARLMSVAEAGSVTVSQSARRKTQALFDMAARGLVPLKGKSQPVPIFVVAGARTTPDRAPVLDALRSPLVGRDDEWAEMRTLMERLRAGQGQVVSIVGEAGLGKSRLAAEVRQAQGEAVRWLEARCLSYTDSVSFFPMREIVQQALGIQPGDSQAEAWSRAREALQLQGGLDDAQTHLPYLANFLRLPLDAVSEERVKYLDAEALQRRTFVAIRAVIEALALDAARPLALVVDDVQWIDQASIGLIEYLLPLTREAPLLVMLLYRPEHESSFQALHERLGREYADRATEIALRRLSSDDSRQLLANLLPLDPWPDKLRDLILDRTEGNPLYVEELIRALMDGGVLTRGAAGWQVSGRADVVEVPDTLEGVMMARLDRLNEDCRHTTQVASVVGRIFPVDVLANALSGQTDRQLDACLTVVQEHEIARQAERVLDPAYMFRHGLMQEVCYGNLLARSRRLYHRKIAAYLETSQGESDNTIPLIAHHAFAGQDWERAIFYQMLAGEQAQKLFANSEAIEHFGRALQSADNLPPEGTRRERLTIRLNLGELLVTTGRYDDAVTHLDRAGELAVGLGEADALARAHRWRARLHELRGEYPVAQEWIERGLAALDGRENAEAAHLRLLAGLINIRQGNYDQALAQSQAALAVAEKVDDVRAIARANNLLGIAAMRADRAAAIGHFQRALELYTRVGDLQGQATSHNLIANAHFALGRWKDADFHYRRAREAFHQMGDLYNRAIADNNLGGIAQNQGRLDEALDFYQTARQSLEQIGGSTFLLGVVSMNRGAAHIRRGEVEPARRHLAEGRSNFEQAQAREFLPELIRHVAEAALTAGDLAEAEAEVRAALQLARELSMRGEEGNGLRVLGEVELAQGRLAEAVPQLEESVAILEEVADDYELARSRLTLAGALGSQGRRADALAAVDQALAVFERLQAALDVEAARRLRLTLQG